MTDSVAPIDDNADIAQITDKDELLAQLREVHVPDVSAWPAPGWWVLAIVLIGVLVAGVLFKIRRKNYENDAWRREALAELSQLKGVLPSATAYERHEIIQKASSLLRRVMILTRGRSQVAGLTADAWLSELSQHGSVQKLSESLHPLVTDAPYQTEATALETSDNVGALLSWLHETIEAFPKAGTDASL